MPCTHVNAGTYCGLRIKIRDEIEIEFVGTMPDHDCVGICPAENLVSDFEFIIDLLRIVPTRGARG